MKLSDITLDAEFQSLIPPLTEQERADLEASLKADGCISPLVVWQGQGILLDGHNRLACCLKHDIACKVHEISFDSREAAKTWIIKHQLGRRNISESQRAMLAATLEEIYAGQAKQRMAEGGRVGGKSEAKGVANLPHPLKGRAREQAAADMNVSPRLVQAAKTVKNEGTEKLQLAVQTGEVSVSAAAEVARLPEDQQDQIVTGGKKEVARAARRVRQRRRRELASDALKPIRGHSRPDPKTVLSLPHNPVYAANTLISVFDREFLVGLVSELTHFLDGHEQ